MSDLFDLQQPEIAYMFAFFQGDGHLFETTRNRGRLSVELSVRDESILHEFSALMPCRTFVSYRTRETNFARRSATAVWFLHDRTVREDLKELGLPPGRKCETIQPPLVPYSARDYLRGWIDADGSVGVTGAGRAFVSLTTRSEAIKDLFIQHVETVTGRRKVATRNRRDGVFNLVVLGWMAYDLADDLYYPNCLALARKYVAARRIVEGPRPPVTKDQRTWLPEDDEIVLSCDNAEAALRLDRTIKSVQMRRWRLSRSTTGRSAREVAVPYTTRTPPSLPQTASGAMTALECC